MMRKLTIAAALLAALPVAAQVRGAHKPDGCLDVSDTQTHAPITARGVLSRRVFAGAPNFESVAKGDEAEPGYLLTLPASICVDDGGNFADPKKRFREVQVLSTDRVGFAPLRALAGKRVTITGTGMPAMTGHHHRPLLLRADTVAAGR